MFMIAIIIIIVIFIIILIKLLDISHYKNYLYSKNNTLSFEIVLNKEQLDTTPWGNYISLVYGKETFYDKDFPIDPSTFLMFYTNYLEQCAIPFDKYNLNCPDKTIKNDLLYNMSREHDPPLSVWLTTPASFTKNEPIPSYTYVEVTHCIDKEVLENEKYGSWMYLATGSGIYFFLGNTIIFDDHNQAVNFFLPGQHCYDTECTGFFKDIIIQAKKEFIDSIQFLNHSDMRCGYIAHEIIDVNGSGIFPCPINNERYATGYKALRPLFCDGQQQCLNKDGY